MIKIYTIICPETLQVKYIGKSKRKLKYRLTEHIKMAKHKNTLLGTWIKSLNNKNLIPIIEELDIANNEEIANILEIMYIGLFKSWGFKLKNMTNGGDGMCNMTKETKDKISKTKIGKYSGENNPFYNKKHTEESLEKMRNEPRPLHFAKQCSEITKKLFKDGVLNVSGKNNPMAKKIGKFDEYNNLIKIYDYITEAEKDGYKRRLIHYCLSGKNKKYKGFVWRYI